MKSAQLSALLAIPALLTGCGGGSEGGSGGNSTPPAPTPKYTINFIKLNNVSSGSEGSCAIYGQDLAISPTEYTLGYTASGQDMNVYIHAADGQLLKSFSHTSWSNGRFTVNQNEIPADGYISIAYKTTAGVGDDYDVLTIQKDLIPNAFSVNAKGETVSANDRCITEATPTATVNYTGVIADGGIGAGQFAFASSVDFQVKSTATNIPFLSLPQEPVLATRYEYSATPTGFEPLLAYAFSTANNNVLATPLNLTAVDNSALDWNVASSTTTLTKSDLVVYRDGAGAIHWQTLPNSVSGTYSYASSLADDYRLNLEGTHNSWLLNYTTKLPDVASGIDEVSIIDALGIPSPQTTNQLSGSHIESYTTPMPSEFIYQRTLVAAASGANSVHQTIYAKAEQNQPLMVFENSLDSIWGTALVKFEVSVLSDNDSSNVRSAFISNYFKAHQVVDAGASSAKSTDSIAVLKTLNERTKQQNELKYLENLELSYAN